MRWEYMTLKLATSGLMGGKLDEERLTDEMNRLGRHGWELAAALDTNQLYGESRDVIILFKRPLN